MARFEAGHKAGAAAQCAQDIGVDTGIAMRIATGIVVRIRLGVVHEQQAWAGKPRDEPRGSFHHGVTELYAHCGQVSRTTSQAFAALLAI